MRPFLVLLLAGHCCIAQSDSLQQQINTQVWKPFIQTFNSLDADGFMALHSKELSRVVQDDNRIDGYVQYYENNKKSNAYAKQNKQQRTIELRFVQRIAGNDRAFEIGYYKVTIASEGKTNSFYGKFHVLMRKERGVWKILMDADAHEKTDEAVFQSGKPM